MQTEQEWHAKNYIHIAFKKNGIVTLIVALIVLYHDNRKNNFKIRYGKYLNFAKGILKRYSTELQKGMRD